jgi:hypothetical protein
MQRYLRYELADIFQPTMINSAPKNTAKSTKLAIDWDPIVVHLSVASHIHTRQIVMQMPLGHKRTPVWLVVSHKTPHLPYMVQWSGNLKSADTNDGSPLPAALPPDRGGLPSFFAANPCFR